MSYAFPPELDRLVQKELATGVYASEDEVLLEAVRALRDRDEVDAAIREGLDDVKAGRLRPLHEVDAELRARYSILRDE